MQPAAAGHFTLPGGFYEDVYKRQVMDGGRLLCTGTPAEVGGLLRQEGHRMFLAMPSAMRIWASVQSLSLIHI